MTSALLLGMASVSAVPAQAAERPANTKLAAFFEREHQYHMRIHPEEATFVGINDYNDRLSDLSFEAIARDKAHDHDVLATLERFDPKALNTQDAISRDLMLDDLRMTRDIDALYGRLPFTGIGGWMRVGPGGGPHTGIVALVKATPFVTVRDYDNYLKRLSAFPRRLAQTEALMREGMRTGWMPPRAIMSRVSSQFDVFVATDIASNPLFRPFQDFPGDIASSDRQRLVADGRRVLTEQVAPALETFRRFVVEEYIPACTDRLAASALPAGERYYALTVRRATTTTMTPREVHEIGLAEVDRIGKQMAALIADLHFEGTRIAFYEKIRADPQFYFTRADDMLMAYRDIAKRVDAELPKLFMTLPRLPYGVRAMEAYEGDNAEHYTAGALDGSRAGYFEANVLSLSTRPRYDMENTFLHEAVPGHHLQTARAGELHDLPTFRRSNFYVGFGEGWALYAESLGPLLGLYKDPYSKLGALSWEMVRACRLVIDTGLHAFDWTREQAIQYMMDNAGLQRGFAAAEIDRYLSLPGQATGYKIGQLKIVELRERARAALGDRFDVRAFHNAVLDDGALPLTVLEQRIDRWIDVQRRAPVTAVAH